MTESYTSAVSTVTMDDGARLHVKVIGDDPTKTKPLLISLHGAPGVSTHLEPEASYAFLGNIFRVLVFDARGSGESDLIGPYSHNRWIKDIENLRRWQGAEKLVLAGASYGAFIALDYATLHGDRLYGLVLRAPWTHGVPGPMTALANILTTNRIKVDKARQVRNWSGTLRDDQDMQDALMELLPIFSPPEDPSSTVSAQDQPELTEFKGSIKFHSATQNYAFSVNMPRFDVRSKLKDIKGPTLVVVGRHDLITPVSGSEEIANAVPRARLEVFEHSGHSPPSDERAKFTEKLSDWLKTEVLPVVTVK